MQEKLLIRLSTIIEVLEGMYTSLFRHRDPLSMEETIVRIHERLRKCTSLSPSYRVNRALSGLCRMVSQRHAYESKILLQPKVLQITDSLRSICARAEYEMEKYWSQKVIRSVCKRHAWHILQRFWYLKNYKDLTVFEYTLLQKNGYVHTPGARVAFIGGGPLPLTALMLWKKYGIKSIVIDNDATAVAMSQKFLQKLGLENVIEVRQAEGETFTDYDNIGVVFAASLAGVDDDEKTRLLNTIGDHIASDTYVVVRSVTGLRALLYPPVNTDGITSLEILDHQDPTEEIINSAYICKKR